MHIRAKEKLNNTEIRELAHAAAERGERQDSANIFAHGTNAFVVFNRAFLQREFELSAAPAVLPHCEGGAVDVAGRTEPSSLQRDMLKRFGDFARSIHDFTGSSGRPSLSPSVAQRNLDELVDTGFIVASRLGYSLTQQGRQWMASHASPGMAPGFRTSTYVPPVWHVRAGAGQLVAGKAGGAA